MAVEPPVACCRAYHIGIESDNDSIPFLYEAKPPSHPPGRCAAVVAACALGKHDICKTHCHLAMRFFGLKPPTCKQIAPLPGAICGAMGTRYHFELHKILSRFPTQNRRDQARQQTAVGPADRGSNWPSALPTVFIMGGLCVFVYSLAIICNYSVLFCAFYAFGNKIF